MAEDERQHVELPALAQLQGLGWSHLDGTTLLPGSTDHRFSLKEVVLTPILEQAIQRINPWISADNLRKVMRDVSVIPASTLMEANQWFWERLTHYFSVEQDLGSGRRGQTVKLIDFENLSNNEFLCIDQLKVQGSSQAIIPDITLYVNGLPLGVIECKSPYVTDPMAEGITQLRRYANLRNPGATEGCEKLFHYNQVMIATHRDVARVGTISSTMEHYLEWKDPYPLSMKELGETPHSQQVLIQGLLAPANFLDLIQNFTIFETESGRTIKKIARYQQFRAVQKTILRLKQGADRKAKGGVIWATQGSGKSLTMVFLTLKIRRDPLLRTHKLVFLTDRTQLDAQLTATFRHAQGETVLNAKSVGHLKELLAKDGSDLITATIQKAQAGELGTVCLNASANIIVLADEAHRTQYGALGASINAALPNAPKIAFTGTPLMKVEKITTTNEFGPYIDTYTIEQAVIDGATVQIIYEGREAKTKVTGDSLDALFDRYFADKTPEQQAEIKRKYGTERAVLQAPQRLEWVGLDMVDHFRSTILPNGFKGIVVAGSRRAAVLLKEQLDKIPGAPESAVIISGMHNDEEIYRKWTNPADHKTAIENFKKPLSEHPLSLLIVKDMLLTGLDAPICQVMYLDRKLTDHTLLQAIARVNRTAANKHCGYIVDYYGLTDYLAEALKAFSASEVQGALRSLKDEIPKLQAAHTRVMQHLRAADLQNLESCIALLADELKRQQFEADFRSFAKQVEIVLPDPAALPFLPDLKALGKITIGCRNRYRDEHLNILGCGEKVRALIEEHVRATGVDPRVPPTKLFDVEFKKLLAAQTSDRAKASEVEHAIKAHLKLKLEDDPEYYQTLSRRLQQIIQKYANKWAELVQQLLLFRDGMEQQRSQQASDLGLSDTEFAFHGVLLAELAKATGEEALDEYTHEQVLALTRELVREFEQATRIVGFFDKWDEVTRIKRQIKRAILDQPFASKELVDAVTQRFMELGKRHFR
jgi:type I restriction enzyme R subunit